MTLGEARKAAHAAKVSMSGGDDPSAAKRRERVARKLAAGITFAAVSHEYVEKAEREGRSPATITKLRWACEWLLPAIGHRPISEIEPHELLAVLKQQENKVTWRLLDGRGHSPAECFATRSRRLGPRPIPRLSCLGRWLRPNRRTWPPSSTRNAWAICFARSTPTRATSQPATPSRSRRTCSSDRASCAKPSGARSTSTSRSGAFRPHAGNSGASTSSPSPASRSRFSRPRAS